MSFGASCRRVTGKLRADVGDAGHVPARAGEACRESTSDRIARRRHGDRNGCWSHPRLRCRRSTDNDEIDVPLRELAGQTRGTIPAAIGGAPLAEDDLTLDGSVFAETLADHLLQRLSPSARRSWPSRRPPAPWPGAAGPRLRQQGRQEAGRFVPVWWCPRRHEGQASRGAEPRCLGEPTLSAVNE